MESLLHDSAFLVILRLVDVTDDTVTVQKSLLDEVKSTQPDVKYTATGDVIGKVTWTATRHALRPCVPH